MAFPHGRGYVLGFSDRTIAEFFEDEFGIDFEDRKYYSNGTSKRLRLNTFIQLEDSYTVAKVLRALFERREGMIRRVGGPENVNEEGEIKQKLLDIISEVESKSDAPRSDALDRYSKDITLDELIQDIERDLQAKKPEAAMDHLHTYCMKKFAHLLKTRGIEFSNNDPLHARFGRYRNTLNQEQNLTDFTNKAMKSAIELFKEYNNIRNNHSFAHDNYILSSAEARYVFDMISAILIFMRTIEAGRYE